MAKVDTILEEIKGLTLLEASDLVKKMEEAFGVSAAAATVVAGGGGAAAGAAPAEEKTEFTAQGGAGDFHKSMGRRTVPRSGVRVIFGRKAQQHRSASRSVLFAYCPKGMRIIHV